MIVTSPEAGVETIAAHGIVDVAASTPSWQQLHTAFMYLPPLLADLTAIFDPTTFKADPSRSFCSCLQCPLHLRTSVPNATPPHKPLNAAVSGVRGDAKKMLKQLI
jgi:hypothetical protein